MTGPGWNERVFTFYTLEGADALRGGAASVRRRPARRAHRRHADQVPGRAAGVHLPRRLVPARARHPQPDGARLRHPARRRLHQTGRVASTSAACWRRRNRARDRVHRRRGRRRRRQARRRTTSARSPSTCWSPCRCTGAPTSSSVRRGSATSWASSRPTSTRCRRRQDERLRARRRHRHPDVQGRLGHPLRGRGLRRQLAASSQVTSSSRASTDTPTASSRPATTRPC